MGKKIGIDFRGVSLNWREDPPTDKQIDQAYRFVPRHIVDRWLEEGRTKGFFSAVLDYAFSNKLSREEALYVDWDAIGEEGYE